MPQVNLSTLSGPELRQLLNDTRERGEAAQSYQILQEMAARRGDGRPRGLFGARRPAEDRIIAVNVDADAPEEPEDDLPPMPPGWRPPPLEPRPKPASRARPRRSRGETAPAAPAPIAPVGVEPASPHPPEPERIVFRPREDQPAAAGADAWDLDGPLGSPPPQPRPESGGFRRGLALGLMPGVAAGVVLGWWLSGLAHEAPPPAPAAEAFRAVAPAPRPPPEALPAAPVAKPEPAPEAPPQLPPETAAGPSATDPPDEPGSPRDAPGKAMELSAAPTAGGCEAGPTPADRTICGDPQLRRLQRELQRAYAEALAAHEDRALLRQRQLAWRTARNDVTDPDGLARLYEQRIRRLNAAAAAARRLR
jgi:uncharacterized protein YecT (DUF1311 family)